jgi:hypothetical protein
MLRVQCCTLSGLSESYRKAKPFPHLVIDDFISDRTLQDINDQWFDGGEWFRKAGRTSIKNSLQRQLPRAANDLVNVLYSSEFIEKLENIVSVKGLLHDPEWEDGRLFGGGLHEINRGGFLKMHVDFNKHPYGVYRRANLLIYLNETWDASWGGDLILGDKVIEPIGKRAVLFGTSEDSWHGHPYPLNTPEGTSRRSLALYYYSEQPPKDFIKAHTTIYGSK